MTDLAGVSLNRFVVFTTVVEKGSFTAAAEALGLSKVAVSQHVTRLESELRNQLLIRTTRKITLTESGRDFYRACATLLSQAQDAVAQLGRSRNMPSGTLRVTATEDFGNTVVARTISRFVSAYPDMRVDFVASNTVLDLVGQGLDLSIRVGWLRDSGLRALRLGGFRQRLVAAPAYLKRHGNPSRPQDLTSHRWIAFSVLTSPLRWSFTAPDKRSVPVQMQGYVSANSPTAMRALLLDSVGISVLPEHLVSQDLAAKRLVHVLPQYQLPEGGIYAVHPYESDKVPAKVRLFIALLREVLTEWPSRRAPD